MLSEFCFHFQLFLKNSKLLKKNYDDQFFRDELQEFLGLLGHLFGVIYVSYIGLDQPGKCYVFVVRPAKINEDVLQ